MQGFFRNRKVARITAPAGAVPRAHTTLIEQRGWTRTKSRKGWAGSYATPYGTWPGHIEPDGRSFRVYIRNPPDAMRRHHKWACFTICEHDWWRIHLAVAPADRDPNAVIQYVERILIEAHRL